MLRILFIICILITTLANNSFAQMSEADFKRTYDLAESDMLYENYKAGLKKWLVLHQHDTGNANIDFKIGYTYLMLKTEKSKSTHYLEQAVQNISPKYKEMDISEKGAPDYAYYYLAKAYHLEGKIDKAIAAYTRYKTSSKLDNATEKDVNRQLEMCNNAKDIMLHPVNLEVQNLGDSINSKFPDYSPVVSADESTIIFTSRREGSTGEEVTEDNSYYEDIYISHKLDSGWSEARQIGSNINTKGHEATINMSADGQQVFIYKDDGGDGNIYVSQLIGDLWTVPKKLPEGINTKSWETHAALSADGQMLYFVSDRSGGSGGRDIYSCKKLPNGVWSSPKNLGPSINTEYDEDAVYLHPDGVHMFFASQGHKSMGGFDIFSTMMSEDGSFSTPENVGFPINTTDDDVFFVVSADGRRAYYSSAHEIANASKSDKSIGEKDIFVLNLVDRDVSNVTIVRGLIRKGTDEDILNNVLIEVADNANNEPELMETRVNNKSGKFLIILSQGKTYKITYNLGKYGTFTDTVMVPQGSPYREIDKEFDISLPDPSAVVSKFMMATDDKVITLINNPVDIAVLENDYTKKGKVIASSIEFAENPKHGNKSASSNGIVTYTPNKDFKGDDSFKYNFKNSQSRTSNNASVAVSVYTAIANNINASTTKNKAVSMDVISSAKIAEGYSADLKSVKTITEPKNGKLTVDKKTGQITYTPNKDYTGSDSFQYEFFDTKKNKSSIGTISITITDDGLAVEGNSGTGCQSSNKEYIKYFKYNKKDIARKEKEFDEFIASLAACLDQGKISVSIESSASKVPTRTYKTNENLSEKRALQATDAIKKALKAKKAKLENLNFEKPNSMVQGPDYNNDYVVNRANYEKYQYIKITVK